jgi:hypothetical protein
LIYHYNFFGLGNLVPEKRHSIDEIANNHVLPLESAAKVKNNLPSAKATKTSEVVSSDDIEEVKSIKRSFIKDSSKVRESSYDKTLNDAFGDGDEEDQVKPTKKHAKEMQAKKEDHHKAEELKDRLKDIGVRVPVEEAVQEEVK